MKTWPWVRDKKGFILMSSYLLISVLSIFSIAVYARHTAFLNASERSQNRIIAFNMAEAGMDFAMAQLRTNPAYAGTGYVSLSTNAMQGGFDITVTTPAGGNPNIRLLQANGYAPGNNNTLRAYETRSVTAYAEFAERNLFDFAVFARDFLQFNGNPVVDSYDSRLGPYNAAGANLNGDIGTDSIAAGAIALIGNADIRGDVMVGPGGDPNTVINLSGNATISGTTSVAPSPRDYEPETSAIPSSGNLQISGNTNYQLPAGTYRFDSIQITGNGRLSPIGPVTIYVDGTVHLAGNGVSTQNNLPPNFILFVTGDHSVQIAGNADFYGAIFAPASAIKNNGNGEIYGAVVSRQYHQPGNADVHFDEALRDLGGTGRGDIKLKSWLEENTSAWGTGN